MNPADPLLRDAANKQKGAPKGGTSGGQSKEEQAMANKEREIESNKLFQEWLKRQQAGEKIPPLPTPDEAEKMLGIKAQHNSQKLEQLKSQFNQFRQYDNQPVYLMKAWVLLAEIIIEQQKAEGKSSNPFSLFTKLIGMKIFGFDGKTRAPQKVLDGVADTLTGIVGSLDKSLSDGFRKIKAGDAEGKLKKVEEANAPAKLTITEGKLQAKGLEGELNHANRVMVNECIEEAFPDKAYQLDEDGYLVKPVKSDDGEGVKKDEHGETVYEPVAAKELNHEQRQQLSEIIKEPSLGRDSTPSP